MEKKNLVISIKAQQRSNASPVNKMFSAYICRKMSVLPAPNTFSPQTLLTAWTWWQCRCWWSSAALWYLPGRLLPSIPGHSFGCHIDSSCFLFRGLYRNINLSKANTDSVLSHKCSICCGGVLLNTFIQQCNVCIRCHQHGVYRVEKRNSSSSSDINISGIHDVLVSGSSTTPIIVNLFPFVFWK